jgi:glucokinase-like ROK family protein
MTPVRTANLELVQKINRSIVLNVIRDKGPLSRADISRRTKLTRSTVSNIVNHLKKRNLVKETGLSSSGVGRRGILLELNPQAYYVVGVDLGTLNTIAAVVDLEGKIVERVEHPTNGEKNREDVIERVKAAIHEVISSSNINLQKVAGIGLAVPGLVDTKKGIMLITPNFGWKDTHLKEILEEEFHTPTFIDNNVNAMALSEAKFGIGRGVKNFICVNVGMGIGSGVIINGEIYRGETECTGEIGHTTVDYNGPKCSCGNNGCLEVMAAGPAIARRAVKAIREGRKTVITELVKDNLNQITAAVVVQAANQGDELAREIMEETGEYLGTGIANIINLFNPQMIVIGGGVAQAGDLIFNPLKKTMKKRAFPVPAKVVKITTPSLGRDCTVIGAATLVLKDIFKSPKVISS